MSTQPNLAAVASQFQIDGDFSAATPYGSGHINDTYLAVFHHDGAPARVILQRINTSIFTRPIHLMQNIQRVSTHLAAKVAGQPDADRRVLTLIPARNARPLHVDADGNYWRAYRFIQNARTYDAVESTQQAFQAGRAFGRFQQLLVDLPAPPLHHTIPNFHDTPKRFAALQQAIASDVANRAIAAQPEIEFALAHQSITAILLDANLPERVTHNDTKLNNVMLDSATGEAICVIDLDTVMPGLALYDFGDMVRTTTSPAPEDELDLSRVHMQLPMFEALVRGYLSTARGFLTKAEKRLLTFSGKLITFETGLRFLTDYLAGDSYYKVHRPDHNLHRSRTQFRLVQSIEQQQEAMDRLVHSVS
jgi:Ser/Thr protein kinase RdoA (MazF antagonist)